MDQRLYDVLQPTLAQNYIHPFLGISDKDSREDIEKKLSELYNAGIYSMVLMYHKADMPMMELNPFDDAWWERLEWISDICREKKMTYMMQDAAPFPTGEANGWFKEDAYQSLNKLYLAERHMDIKGPLKEGKFLVQDKVASPNGDYQVHTGDPRDCKLVSICALKRKNEDDLTFEDLAIPLDDKVQDGVLYWDVPCGSYRIFIIYETYEEGGRKGYMNLLDPDSVRLQIEAVHKPHYERLKQELGKTWLGFFYDETEIGNVTNLHGYIFGMLPGKNPLGVNVSMVMPWSRTMPDLCRQRFGEQFGALLPFLWYDGDTKHSQVRYHYMDIISRQIAVNYNTQVYGWCHERGILYIGHNLEDENSHAHLGCGPVHYFRMQEGQDMAGIDLISGQLLPEMDSTFSWFGAHDADGAFYHYGLAKLAASAGRIDPKKQGQSFCELLAVYGSIAGPKLRKFVVDHLLVNGVNHMIFADAMSRCHDLRYNRKLDDYTNRMCHLFNDVQTLSKVAVLYHAESEWTDRAEYFQIAGRELARNQISYDVIPQDVFTKTDFYRTDTSNGLTVNGICYEALIIPGCRQLPRAAADFAMHAADMGFPVIAVNEAPGFICEDGSRIREGFMLKVNAEDLADVLKTKISADCCVENKEPYLRYNHFKRDGGDYYFLHNENAQKRIRNTVRLQMRPPVYRIDMMEGTVTEAVCRRNEDWVEMELCLGQYESILLYSGTLPEGIAVLEESSETVCRDLSELRWRLTLCGDEGQIVAAYEDRKLFNINAAREQPFFFGKIIYETVFEADAIDAAGTKPGCIRLSLGEVQEACEVFVNDIPAGLKMAEPYVFDIGHAVCAGENRLKIIVQNNLAHKKKKINMQALFEAGSATGYTTLPRGGLLGPVTLNG